MGLNALLRRHLQTVFQQCHVAAIRFGGFPCVDVALVSRRFHCEQCSVVSEIRNQIVAPRFLHTIILTAGLPRHTLPNVKRRARQFVLFVAIALPTAFLPEVQAETETIDLKALAKKARPAVMLLVVSDATGKEIATGTGFLVSKDGKLITNHHVIENGANVVAKAENGGRFSVLGVLADDGERDLALLALDGKDFKPLPLGSTSSVESGTRVAVIGSPLGLEGTLSEGIVSAVRDYPTKSRWIQITAALSPGSSGSPVLSVSGDVIGVATAELREGQALNFAIPVEAVKELLAKARTTNELQTLPSFAKRTGEEVFSDPDYKTARTAYGVGNYAEALKSIKATIARFPNSSEAFTMLGDVFYGLRFMSDAAGAYKTAIKLNPNAARPWFRLGLAYLDERNYLDASVALEQTVKISPDNAFAWNWLGDAYCGQNRFDNAVTAYKQATKLDPDFGSPWFGLARVYESQGNREEAISIRKRQVERWRTVIQGDPKNGKAWSNLWAAYSKTEMKEFCRSFLRAKTDTVHAWLFFSMSCETQEDRDQLKSFCKEAIMGNPENRAAWEFLCESSSGEPDFACLATHCEEELRERPKNPVALWFLSIARHKLGQEEQAKQALQKLREIDPQQAHKLEDVLKQPATPTLTH